MIETLVMTGKRRHHMPRRQAGRHGPVAKGEVILRGEVGSEGDIVLRPVATQKRQQQKPKEGPRSQIPLRGQGLVPLGGNQRRVAVEKELQVCGAGTVVAENHNRSGSPGAPYPQKRSNQQALRQGDERGAGGKHQPHQHPGPVPDPDAWGGRRQEPEPDIQGCQAKNGWKRCRKRLTEAGLAHRRVVPRSGCDAGDPTHAKG